jgi:hypothetical protein
VNGNPSAPGEPAGPAGKGARQSVPRYLVPVLAALVVGGIPFVAYLWETLNQVLAGHVDAGRIAVSLLVTPHL